MKPSGPGKGFISGNGHVEAREIDLATKLAGRVQRITVDEGDFVEIDEPLAQIQSDVLNAQRDEAQAPPQQAITAVASAEAQVAARQSDTAAAQAAVGQGASELDAAQRRFARTQALAKDGALSLQEFDDDRACLFGKPINANDLATRRRVGYMSQEFSLYTELSVRQNLVLAAHTYQLPKADIPARVDMMAERFSLAQVLDAMPDDLPLGIKQRMSLAVAMIHQPELLILDEPTSGVDPIARDVLWQLMADLSRHDRVTIFISTHFMDEGARCDRISLMNDGKVLVTGVPAELVRQRGLATLEATFISYLKGAEAHKPAPAARAAGSPGAEITPSAAPRTGRPARRIFNWNRAWSCSRREALELRDDPMRATMAFFGCVLLMCIMGYGMSLDVENLKYAVLDRDQTLLSQNYALNLSGSPRYFKERPPIADYAELDRRMRSGELALAVEIPPNFARDLERGKPVAIAAWVDGSMPQRAETVEGYVQDIHQAWLVDLAGRLGRKVVSPATIETRYRYNPDVLSLPAMVPSCIPVLLLMIPAMLAALSVVREKELGSILNLYVTPVTRTEFLVGKQLPYLALAMLNFGMMTLMAVTLFGVPLKGSFLALAAGALLFVRFSTGFGLFCSTFTRSQIATVALSMIATLVSAFQFWGLLNPVFSLAGAGAFIGRIYPAAYFLNITRGVFNKAPGFSGLHASFWPLLIAAPVMVGAAILLLKKQES